MKHTITLIVTLLISISTFAQQGINYKAVVKDGSGNLVSEQTIGVQFTILEDAVATYVENHTTTMTDANGIVILNIGQGTATTGTFGAIDWSKTTTLKTEIDIDGGLDNLADLGTTQFMAVPYALSSADNLWQLNGANAIAIAEKVGIGTGTPTELLQISDPNIAGLKLDTPDWTNSSNIKLENGDITDFHTFYKIENINDEFSIAVDSDINSSETGYVKKLSVSATGSLKLVSGASVNEFSTDGTLAGNSNNAVPTEAAVKAYVDNLPILFTEEIVSLIFGGSQTLASTSFVTIQATASNSLTITNNTSFITVHINVDGTITKYFTNSSSPQVVAYPGSEGTSINIKIFGPSSKMLFFDGIKLTGNHIVGLLKVKD